MKNVIAIALLFLLCHAPQAQMLQAIVQGKSAPGFTAPTFVDATGLPQQSGTDVASITSPALTLSAGDLVVVYCTTFQPATFDRASSTPANTFAYGTFQNSNQQSQISYAIGVAAGSTTFTCTPSAASGYQTMQVLHYHPGSLTALDLESISGSSSGGIFTTSAFSTSASGLVILCGLSTLGNTSWTPGAIGGTTATLRTGATTTSQCEDLTTSGAQTNITAAIQSSGPTDPIGGNLVAFK